MALSKRLQFIFENLLPQKAVWDFCCDHGYLGLEALQSQNFGPVHFVDQVPHIVERIKEHICSRTPEFLEKAHFRIGKGEDLSSPVDGTAVIAGVGAFTIFKIIESLWLRRVLQAQRLILCPQRDEQKLLQMLENLGPDFQKGYLLKSERVLTERNRRRFVYILDRSPKF